MTHTVPKPSTKAPASWRMPVVLGLGLLVAATLSWTPLPTGIWHDDGVYLLIAKSIAEGDGLTYAGVVDTPPATKFPPVYPAVLAPLWMAGGDLAAGSGWVAGLNTLFLAMAAALFLWFIVRRSGLDPWPALAVGALAWSSPVLFQLAAIPLSEPLFLLFVVAAVISAAGVLREDAWRPLPFLVFFALAFYTRTMGIALLGAGVLALWTQRRFKRGLVLGALGAAIMAPWMLWSSAATEQIAEPFRDLLGGYGGWLVDQVVDDPGGYVSIITANAVELYRGVSQVLIPGASPWVQGVVLSLAAVTVGLAARSLWRMSPLLLLYPACHLAILLLWPYRSGRLLAPAVPFILGAVLAAAVLILRRPAAVGSRLVAAAVCCTAVWSFGHGAWDVATGEHLRPYSVRARTLVRAVEAIERTAPPNAVVGAPELWAAVHLHTGRTVAPSARFLPLSKDGPPWGTPPDQYDMWSLAGIDHLLVEHGGKVHGDALDWLDESCPPGSVAVLASFPGPGFFVRLDLDSGCVSELNRANAE